MARKTPVVREGNLYHFDEYQEEEHLILNIVEDWIHWIEFLSREKSIRFVGSDQASISVIKEMRSHFGDREKKRPVWYAHKRIGGVLRRRYIGKSENMTHEKLTEVATALNRTN